MGISVEYHDDMPPENFGMWFPAYRTVLLRPGMTRVLERSVLAHELGHAAYMHPCSNRRFERQAHRFALRLLIDPNKAVDAFHRHDEPGHVIAELLEIDYDLYMVFRDDVRELIANGMAPDTAYRRDMNRLSGEWANGYYYPDF